jgi:hypothetical protein
MGAQHMGEARGLRGQIGIGQDAPRPVPAEPDDGGSVPVARRDMPVDRLMRDVEPPPGSPSSRARAASQPVGSRRAIGHGRFRDDRMRHAGCVGIHYTNAMN